MATDKKITELDPLVGNLNLSDIGVTVRDDTDFKFTFAQLITLVQSLIVTGSTITFSNDTPPNTSGKNTDVVIKPATGEFFQKIAGVWTLQYTITPGIDGNQLLYGSGAPNSATGSNNDSYIDTAAGVFYKKLSGTWTIQFTMASGPAGATGPAGANGTNGTDGKTVLNGITNPSNDLGTDGDFYINTTTLFIFGPKVSGVWGDGTSLVGLPPSPILHKLDIALPAGSPIPLIVIPGIFNAYVGYNIFKVIPNDLDPLDKSYIARIEDIEVRTKFTDNSYTDVIQYEVYGHEDPDNPGFTIDECGITFYKYE